LPIIEDGNRRYITDDEGEVVHIQTKADVWLQDGEKVFVVKPGRKKEKESNPEFIKLYRTNIIDIITSKKLSMTERGVFLSLLIFVDWQSNFLVHPTTKQVLNDSSISSLIGYDRSAFTDVVKRLNDKGLIIILKNGNGRGNSYMINTNVVFNGRRIKDINEHKAFNNVAYQPLTKVKYQIEKPRDK